MITMTICFIISCLVFVGCIKIACGAARLAFRILFRSLGALAILVFVITLFSGIFW